MAGRVCELEGRLAWSWKGIVAEITGESTREESGQCEGFDFAGHGWRGTIKSGTVPSGSPRWTHFSTHTPRSHLRSALGVLRLVPPARRLTPASPSSSSLSAVLYARRWSCCRPVIALSRVVAHRINLSTTLLGSHQCHLRVISEFINSRHDVVRLTRPRYILTILSRPHGLALPKTSALTLGDFRLNQPSTRPRSPRLVRRCSGYLLDNKTWRSQQY